MTMVRAGIERIEMIFEEPLVYAPVGSSVKHIDPGLSRMTGQVRFHDVPPTSLANSPVVVVEDIGVTVNIHRSESGGWRAEVIRSGEVTVFESSSIDTVEILSEVQSVLEREP